MILVVFCLLYCCICESIHTHKHTHTDTHTKWIEVREGERERGKMSHGSSYYNSVCVQKLENPGVLTWIRICLANQISEFVHCKYLDFELT